MRRRAAAPCVALLLVGAAPLAAAGDAAREVAVARPEDATPLGPSVADRLTEIRRRIEAALLYPPLARWSDVAGEALVGFEIGSDRRAVGIRLLRSSGHAALDAAARRAVLDAGELPWVWGPLAVPVRFALEDGAPSRARKPLER